MNSHLLPECPLLLLCARRGCPDSLNDEIKTAVRDCPDPVYFANLCVSHKVVSAALGALRSGGPFPGSWGQALALLDRCERSGFQRTLRVSHLTDLVAETLTKAGVRFSFIRGVRLAGRFYEDPGFRLSSDVDVLVERCDVREVIEALRKEGLQSKYLGIDEAARAEFKGQTVMRHPEFRLLLDVNWLLTGNSGIGKVEEDIDAVWGRARRVAGCEWELSTEDTLFGLIRHVGHGHGFEHGLLQCCMDVAAILKKEGDRIDWDLIGRLAHDAECMRVVRLFAHFFDEYYRDDTMPTLRNKLPHSGARIGSSEGRLFSEFVIAPLLCRAPARRPFARYVNGLICHTGKLWALDRTRRLFRILAALVWPGRNPLAIMTPYSKSQRISVRRVQYYAVPFVPILPAICLGTLIRLVVARSTHATR